MFDTLNRHFLPPYGCDWVKASNFQRLAARSVTFERSYVCSMPCMSARLEKSTHFDHGLFFPSGGGSRGSIKVIVTEHSRGRA